jgi:restriction system protein
MKITPDEFEKIIAEEFQDKGYKVELTPKSYDYGVDIIAENKVDRVAIQVKMYEAREVNYKDIMYLFAGMHYYKCGKAILVTQGTLDSKAKEAAKKLSVDFREDYQPTINKEKKETMRIKSISDFETIWSTFVVPLQGQEIYTGTGKRNKIIKVTGDFLYRESSTGEKSKIEKEIFKLTFHRLKEQGELTRQEINTEYSKRGSAIITAVFGQIPFIKIVEKPVIKLVWNK